MSTAMKNKPHDARPRPQWAWPVALFAALFGIASILSGGRVLFGGGEASAAAGQIVPFVLWFNFLSGFVYVIAAAGILLWKKWSGVLSAILTAALLATAIYFAIHVMAGGAYELRTALALIFRTLVWIAITILLCRKLQCLRTQS